MYTKFVLLFTIAHVISYTVAGVLALKISKDIYESKKRLCDFLNDMEDKKERKHVEKYYLPAQITRGILMSIVLLPLFSAIENLILIKQFIFFASLMFVYTHVSAASPFMDNIEGQVYFKSKYIQKKSFFKFQFEMGLYSVLFSLTMTLFMHFFI